jgi:hypothetical protein
LQYSAQVILTPVLFSATEIATTLADAPMGVPFPPISVPKASAQDIVESGIPVEADNPFTMGTMAAAKGTLSIKAERIAEIQRMAITVINSFP